MIIVKISTGIAPGGHATEAIFLEKAVLQLDRKQVRYLSSASSRKCLWSCDALSERKGEFRS